MLAKVDFMILLSLQAILGQRNAQKSRLLYFRL